MWCRIWSQLSQKWKEQALLLARYLKKKYNIDAFYSSPVNRAIETAEIISDEYNFEYLINDEIKEIDFWNMTWKKIEEIPKEIDLMYMKDPFNHKHIGWENMNDLFQRVKTFLNEKVYNSDSKEILIVTHDNIIKAFVGVFTWITKEVTFLKISNCSIVEYEINENDVTCLNFNLNYYLNSSSWAD